MGVILVMSGCMGLSRAYVLGIRQQLRRLLQLSEVLEFAREEICYGRATIPQILCTMRSLEGNTIARVLADFGEEMCGSFQIQLSEVAYRKELLENLPGMAEETKYLLGRLMLPTEGFDGTQIQRRLSQCLEHLQKRSLEEEGLLKERERIAYNLGLTGGLFLIVLLL